MDNIPYYYASIIFSQIADIVILNNDHTKYNKFDIENKEKLIIFILNKNDFFDYVFNQFIEKIKVPFIIITAMEDSTFPKEYNPSTLDKIKNNKYFHHWYSINKSIPNNDYFTSIPYGLDYHTLNSRSLWLEPVTPIMEQDSILCSIANNTPHFSKRINKIYVNCHLHMSDYRFGNFRGNIQHIIPNNITHFQENFMKRTDMYKELTKYAFVLSPFGNGIDCIRTFEALILGCIPILHRSFIGIDSLYQGLPVIIVSNWGELTEEFLEKSLNELKDKTFQYEKLTMKYWLEVITNRFDRIEGGGGGEENN